MQPMLMLPSMHQGPPLAGCPLLQHGERKDMEMPAEVQPTSRAMQPPRNGEGCDSRRG